MIVGEVEILVVPNTTGFKEALSDEGAFAGLEADAGTAGLAAGGALRDGVAAETAGIADDVKTNMSGLTEDAMGVGGMGIFAGRSAGDVDAYVEENRAGLEEDLANREKYLAGLEDNSGKVKGVEEDLTKSAEGGGGAIKGLLGNLGIPESLLGGWGALAIGVAGVAAAGVDMASKYQSAVASIATSEGITVSAAKEIGDAFLGTAGKTEFSAKEQAEAFAGVAGQLRSVKGEALTTKESLDFMDTAMTLATATGQDLGSTTSTLATILQAFGMGVHESGAASNILFNAANATGQSVDQLGQQLVKTKTKLGDMAPPLGQMAGLLVDMANNGQTGRAAMSSLTTMFTTLLKPAADATKAQIALKVAGEDLPPSLRAVAAEYEKGKISASDLTKVTNGLSGSNATLFSAYVKAAQGVDTANVAQQTLGVTVTDSQGKFVGLGSIIGQLHDKIAGQSDAQATATLTALGFGSSAAKLLSIVRAGPEAYDKATEAANRHNAVTEAANIKSHTLSVEIHTLLAMFEDWGVEIGEHVVPVLSALLGVAVEVITTIVSMAEWLLKNKEVLIPLVAVIATAMIPAMVEWASGLYAVVAAWIAEKIQAIASMAETIIAMGPLLIAIGVVAFAVYEIIKHWKAIAAFFVALWHDVVDIFKDAFNWIMGLVRDALDFIKSHWELLLEILTGPIGWVVLAWQHFHGDITRIFMDVVHDIGGFFNDIANAGWGVVMDVIHFFKKIPSEVVHLIESGASDVLKAFEKWIPGGSIVGSALNMIGLADGGIVTQPTMAVVGEAGPEAVIPLAKFGATVQSGLLGGSPVRNLNLPTGNEPTVGGEQRPITINVTQLAHDPHETANELNFQFRAGALSQA